MDRSHKEQLFDGVPLSQWHSWLLACQANFGRSPREFDVATSRMLLVNPPWITKLRFGDALAKLVQNNTLGRLFRTGVVVWGHVVQANVDLFSPAPSVESYTYDRAGEVVFSLHEVSLSTPIHLEQVAGELAGLKYSGDLDSELQPWADYLNAETVRVVGWQVPTRLSPSTPCFVSTTLFRRSHLPTGVLQQSLFPLVVATQQPHFAMPLPQDYWPLPLLQWWSKDAQPNSPLKNSSIALC